MNKALENQLVQVKVELRKADANWNTALRRLEKANTDLEKATNWDTALRRLEKANTENAVAEAAWRRFDAEVARIKALIEEQNK
jgi:chromosome segregation ATPase